MWSVVRFAPEVMLYSAVARYGEGQYVSYGEVAHVLDEEERCALTIIPLEIAIAGEE